jgi:hypothetical protein
LKSPEISDEETVEKFFRALKRKNGQEELSWAG